MQYRAPGLPGDLRPQVGQASGSPAFGGALAVGFGGAGAAGFGGALGAGGFGALAADTGGFGAAGTGAGFGGAGAEYTSSRSSTDFVAARAGGGGDIGIGNPSS